jgi:hypothetical protein
MGDSGARHGVRAWRTRAARLRRSRGAHELPPGAERGPGPARPVRLAALRRRHALEVLVVSCVVLIPWTAYLGFSLPVHYVARQWRLTWVGFDVGLLLALAGTAYFGWRRRQAVIPLAITTAVLLVCDAWFDIMLDWGTAGVWWSVASAVFVELPLAAFLLSRAWLLLHATFRLAWAHAGRPGPPPPLRRVPLLLDPTARTIPGDPDPPTA